MRESSIFLALSNDTNGLSLFRAPMLEDILYEILSTWFFQVNLSSIKTPNDLAFSTWLIFFLQFGFGFAECFEAVIFDENQLT